LLGAALLTALLGWTRQAEAVIIFDNFDTGDAYRVDDGRVVANASGSTVDLANRFRTPSGSNLHFDKIELAVSLSGGPNELDVFLTQDVPFRADGYGAPGTVIESFHFSNQMGTFGNMNTPLVATSILRPILSSDTRYWVVALAPEEGTIAFWNYNLVQTFDPSNPESFLNTGIRRSSLGGAWEIFNGTQGVFRVHGIESAIPEPSSLLLFGTGLLGLAGAGRRRSKAQQVLSQR